MGRIESIFEEEEMLYRPFGSILNIRAHGGGRRDQDNDKDIFSLYIVVIPFFIQMVLKNEILIASCSKEFEYNQSTHTNHPDILDKLRQYETDKVQVIKDVHMVDDDNEDDEEIKVESQESIFDEILLNPNEKPSIKIEQNVKTFW
eukprot:CAMPEP_0117424966 /NCGR_PEP_ID=MMETSP0758-20121206/5302_1 /TAXON_ID=63605 /ORGANISM="Percolomonas cosmopolitus, Strain AE-1 (ATCC 50343)" /LENGTH=145 /DNA_ID=CAMNT_0005209107 /DNA_START=855 /DNA_END=1289 /DNA_ORIENTATION=+